MTYSMGFTKEFAPSNKIIKQVTCWGQEHSCEDSIQLPSFDNNMFFFVFCSPVE